MKTSTFVRDRGYEALFFLGGFLSLSLRPTLRHAMDLDHEMGKALIRRKDLQRLRENGLLEMSGEGGGQILKLTERGRCVFEGGRHPEEAWSRAWDGQFRWLIFDLPEKAGGARTKFWRWLRANHFGRLQGSVWATPDPVPEIGQLAEDAGLDPAMFVLITGGVEGARGPREIAADAWPFETVNEAHQEYMAFANRTLGGIRKGTPSAARLKKILSDDRKQWWRAVQRDPLLPRALLPRDYAGIRSWKLRQKLHGTLQRSVKHGKEGRH